MKSKRGAFIVFEGCDRVGKSTQVRQLIKELKKLNINVATFAFPDRSTVTGKKIDRFLTRKDNSIDKKSFHSLFSENRRELEPEMRRLISQGTTLLVDRYSYSGVAFAAANQFDKKWCWKEESGLPKPDLVIFLRLSLEKAAARNDYGNELYEKLDFQEKVLHEYMKMADSTWQIIDVDDKDINTVKSEIFGHIIRIIQQVDQKSLERFS